MEQYRQYWRICNIDSLETFGGWGELGGCLFGSDCNVLERYLAIPIGFQELDQLISTTTKDSESSQASPLAKPLGRLTQPVEIIHMIFEEMTELHDALCFGLANSRLLAIGQHHIKKLMLNRISWAGKRIICIGDYAQDVPEGMLSDKEIEDFKSMMVKEPEDETQDDDTLNLYDLPYRPARWPVEQFATPLSWGEFWGDEADGVDRINHRIIQQPSYDSESSWVLCNLSKYEFVNYDDIRELGRKAKGDIGIGRVVLSRICWSTDPSVGMSYEGGIHRGVWAGDRFESTTIDRMRAPKAGQEWKDVTSEVIKEISTIWESCLGPDWCKGEKD